MVWREIGLKKWDGNRGMFRAGWQGEEKQKIEKKDREKDVKYAQMQKDFFRQRTATSSGQDDRTISHDYSPEKK